MRRGLRHDLEKKTTYLLINPLQTWRRLKIRVETLWFSFRKYGQTHPCVCVCVWESCDDVVSDCVCVCVWGKAAAESKSVSGSSALCHGTDYAEWHTLLRVTSQARPASPLFILLRTFMVFFLLVVVSSLYRFISASPSIPLPPFFPHSDNKYSINIHRLYLSFFTHLSAFSSLQFLLSTGCISAPLSLTHRRSSLSFTARTVTFPDQYLKLLRFRVIN